MQRHNIQILPPIIANQIAAGEVVERPASVVKELLENALDAGATQLSIDIHCGGLNAITISDNGHGIPTEELLLAVHPHATSKITALDDLAVIQTMGFRGEALASIASVSKLIIQSKPFDQVEAMQLSVHGGEVMPLTPCAHNVGTTISVQELFYNAPVRKRFLKSARTEFLAIERVVRALALSVMSVGIALSHQGRTLLSLPAGASTQHRLQRLQKVLGKPFVEAALFFEQTIGPIHLSGWLANSAYTRSQADRMWTYVNHRFVSDKLLNHAIRQAYEAYLAAGRYPACVLYIDIDPTMVDVNVHPTKHELRFHEPRLVHDAILSVVTSVLQRTVSDSLTQGVGAAEAERRSLVHALEITAPVVSAGWQAGAMAWCPISARYAMIDRGGQYWLLDVFQLQRDCLRSQLIHQAFPFSSRPLFVPIYVEITVDEMVNLQSSFTILADVGFTLSLLEDARLIVRDIPTSVPHLDIPVFLKTLLKHPYPLTRDTCIDLLVTHQALLGTTATTLEKQTWLTYLATCSPHQQEQYARLLSTEVCEQLFQMPVVQPEVVSI